MLEALQHRYPALWPWIQLMRLDRPIGTLLLLWPTLWAVWVAGDGSPSVRVVIVFTLGVIVMRAAGCVINDYADRNFDGEVSRTRNRPLATGALRGRDALMLFAGLMAVALVLVLLLNRFTFYLAFVGAALAIIYPFMKRFTFLPQLFLGAAFAWAIPMAFAAETGSLPAAAWLIFVAKLLWTVAYDTQYAMCDREDDLKVGIKSTAILFGEADRLIIGILQLLALWPLWLLGQGLGFGWPWYLAMAVAAGLFIYQQWLIRDREPAACFRAFLNNQWVGAVLFAGIFLQYLL
ncbi:4-hydroxybenzoate octaprenyltransferase [Alcanivorax sp. JB21]|uniref:4-hydroxybenzoate octaprenyltransferase n=1 Tax=Alcanivorax limicola TaxID=2874102 RepID=UPI001CBFEA37|nr:4-hydroxybenzoate octaprenyltransferase [Alcanivorax limicola]MBZ2188776.1 4-hydroxybenzoate octaprenyltransferase [Alcanivorax limicola]